MQTRRFCLYAIKHLGKSKIAVVYLRDGFGQSGLDGAEAAVKENGQTLAAVIPVERTETNRKAESRLVIQGPSASDRLKDLIGGLLGKLKKG